MRLFALRAAVQFLRCYPFGAIAADLVYPPPVVEQPQYGMAPPPAVAPPPTSLSVRGYRHLPSMTAQQLRPRWLGLLLTTLDLAWTSRRAQCAHQVGAAATGIAVGSGTARHIPSATSAHMDHLIRRSTRAPATRPVLRSTQTRALAQLGALLQSEWVAPPTTLSPPQRSACSRSVSRPVRSVSLSRSKWFVFK